MKIEEFNIIENKTNWTLTRISGKVEVSFNVSKELCPTLKDLTKYVENLKGE